MLMDIKFSDDVASFFRSPVRDIFKKVVSVSFLEFGEGDGTVRKSGSPQKLGLVSEKSLYSITALFLVDLVNVFNKRIGDGGIKQIDVKRIYLVIIGITVFFKKNVIGVARKFCRRLINEGLKLIVLSHFENYSVGKARGPAVLIVRPRAHTESLTLAASGIYVIEPLIPHILGEKSASCVHKITADARIVHKTNLSCGLFGIEFLVP